MTITRHLSKLLIALPILLLGSAFAQETKTKVELHEDILKKGMTWHYDVTLIIPEGVNSKPEHDKAGEETKRGTVYTFKETQQSVGKEQIKDLETDAARVNIYIDNLLKKQQLLDYVQQSLLYYGTYKIDPKNPEKKAGYVTRAPIVLYSEKAEVAQKWEWKHNKIPAFQFRVISKDSEITVKAGTFKADKIRMEQVDSNSGKALVSKEIWFAKGVGVIKEVEKQHLSNGKAIRKTLELTKYGVEELRPEVVIPEEKESKPKAKAKENAKAPSE